MRMTMRLAALLAALAALALQAAGGAAAKNATPDPKLLHAYEPVLVFHPNELFRPTKVQSFVNDSVLERFVGTNTAQLPLDSFWTVVDTHPGPGNLPELAPGVVYRLNQAGCEADAPLAGAACYADASATGSGGPTMYGRVVRTETRIVLQYWLFYYDNPLLLPPTPFGTFWQSHEADWELVNVVLGADEQPIEAAYSQHCSGKRMPWGDVELFGSTHPVAYVALGSHANYFEPGVGPLGAVPISIACITGLPPLPFLQVVDQVLDGSSSGAVVGPPGSGFPAATIHPIEGAPWSTFGGRWGESEYLFTPIPLGPVPAGAIPVGLAPASPPHQANWNVQVILAWPPA